MDCCRFRRCQSKLTVEAESIRIQPAANGRPWPIAAPCGSLAARRNCGIGSWPVAFAAATRRRTEYAQDARRSTRVPSAAAGGWRISPQGGRHGCRPVWRQAGEGMDARVEVTQEQLPDALSTNPGARPRTFRTGMPGKRVSGVAFSLLRASCPPPFGPASPFAPLLRRSGYFLLATQEKGTRPPKEDESSCSRQLHRKREEKIKSGPLPNPPQ
jgi:hypothetical protein